MSAAIELTNVELSAWGHDYSVSREHNGLGGKSVTVCADGTTLTLTNDEARALAALLTAYADANEATQ